MYLKPGDTFYAEGYTSDATGLHDADALPTGILSHNGVDTVVTVPVSHKGTGRYLLTGVLPSGGSAYAAGDTCQVIMLATVGGITGGSDVLDFTIETSRISDVAGNVTTDLGDDVTELSNLTTIQTALTAVKVITDKLAAMLNNTPAFTTAALANAPAGGGGGGVSVLYGEAGAIAKVLTVNDSVSGLGLPGVAVYVSADSAGTQRSQTKITDDNGQVTFHLDAGTVYLWLSRIDRSYSNPYAETVA